MKLLDDGSLIKDFMEDSFQVDVPLSTLVEDPGYEDERFKEKPPPSVEEEFPLDSKVFFLGNQNFGMPADIAGYNGNLVNIKLLVNGRDLLVSISAIIVY